MAHLNPISLDELKDNAMNCRLKRHRMTMTSHEHGRSAETKPDSTICARAQIANVSQQPYSLDVSL